MAFNRCEIRLLLWPHRQQKHQIIKIWIAKTVAAPEAESLASSFGNWERLDDYPAIADPSVFSVAENPGVPDLEGSGVAFHLFEFDFEGGVGFCEDEHAVGWGEVSSDN